MKIVCNGAGAASIACVELLKVMGVKANNVILCDRAGPIYKGRKDSMNQWKSAHAADTDARSLERHWLALIFSLACRCRCRHEKDGKKHGPKPVIFAMANPIPEIMPDDVKAVRDDAIIATGGLIFQIR